MVIRRHGYDHYGMSEVLIAVQRPASMTESEMRTWLTERDRARKPTLALSGPHGSGNQSLLLCVEVPADSIPAVDEQLTDLMMDMRLLGMRPAILSGAG
jgi:hypothetical protein